MTDPYIFDTSDETAFVETSNEFSWALNIDNGDEGSASAEYSPHSPSPPKLRGTVSLSTPAALNGLYPSDETFDPIFDQPDSFASQISSHEHNVPLLKQRTDKNLKRRCEDEARNP